MLKSLPFTALILFLCINYASTAAQVPVASSEKTFTRLDKQEIIGLMAQVSDIPDREQNNKLDQLLKKPSGSQTPRSDFLFCMGLAYLGNQKAQKCVGNAYEKGRGIVEDLLEAYTWFALSQEHKAVDSKAELARVKTILVSTYPAPSDDELDEMVKAQKRRISQYQDEFKNTGK